MTTPTRRTFNHALLGTLAAYGLIETLFRQDAFAESVKPVIGKWMGELNALSKELKKQGWKFVGPTTVYAFMQAMGLINDHLADCVIRAKVAAARKRFRPPGH